MTILDFGYIMDAFVYEDYDGKLEKFDFIMNIIDDKTYEVIFDYENASYALVSKFFVVMERILGGCTLNHIVFDRRNQKIIVEDEWHDISKRKKWFKKAYKKIKQCFIVDKDELEGLIYQIDDVEV